MGPKTHSKAKLPAGRWGGGEVFRTSVLYTCSRSHLLSHPFFLAHAYWHGEVFSKISLLKRVSGFIPTLLVTFPYQAAGQTSSMPPNCAASTHLPSMPAPSEQAVHQGFVDTCTSHSVSAVCCDGSCSCSLFVVSWHPVTGRLPLLSCLTSLAAPSQLPSST